MMRRKALHLHPPRREHILLTMMEGLALIFDHEGTHPSNHIIMAPSPPRLSYLVTDQAHPFSYRMAISLKSDLLVEMANTHI